MSVGPPAEYLHLRSSTRGRRCRGEMKRKGTSARLACSRLPPLPVVTHAGDCRRPRREYTLACSRACARGACLTSYTQFKRKGQREGGKKGGERKSRGELSSSVSHMAGHDNPRRKFLSSWRPAARRLNDYWRMCLIALPCPLRFEVECHLYSV